MVKILVVNDGSHVLKKAIELSKSKSAVEAQPEPLNDLLCPTHIGIDLGSGPDRTAIRCGACGWCGEPKDIDKGKDGIASCPDCKVQWVNGA